MARSVNINILNWRSTGKKVSVDQYETDITLSWVDDNGQQQTWSGTAQFPNDLALVSAAWLKEVLIELLMRAARKRLGIGEE